MRSHATFNERGETDMGVLGDIFFGTALAGLTSMCEDMERLRQGAPVGASGFDALPEARRAELARKVPKWLATVRKRSPVDVTVNLIKNMHVAKQFGGAPRIAAITHLVGWLVREGIAADPNKVLDVYGIEPLEDNRSSGSLAITPEPLTQGGFAFGATMPSVSPSAAAATFEMESFVVTFFVEPPPVVEPVAGVTAPIRYLFAAAVYSRTAGLVRICTLERAFDGPTVYGTFNATGFHSVLDLSPRIADLPTFQRATFDRIAMLYGIRPAAREIRV